MTLSAIHNLMVLAVASIAVVCDIGGYDFVSYSQQSEELKALRESCL